METRQRVEALWSGMRFSSKRRLSSCRWDLLVPLLVGLIKVLIAWCQCGLRLTSLHQQKHMQQRHYISINRYNTVTHSHTHTHTYTHFPHTQHNLRYKHNIPPLGQKSLSRSQLEQDSWHHWSGVSVACGDEYGGYMGAGLEWQVQESGVLDSMVISGLRSAPVCPYQGTGPNWSQHSEKNGESVFYSKVAQVQIEHLQDYERNITK